MIDRLLPAGFAELAQLGRTLDKRRLDILAWFNHPGSRNGPTEAINGRLEHLRGIALGFRNLVNYRLRSLLEAGGFDPSSTLSREEPAMPCSDYGHRVAQERPK